MSSREDNIQPQWVAIGPKGGPYRIAIFKKGPNWFPNATQLAQANWYYQGINVNKAIQELEA